MYTPSLPPPANENPPRTPHQHPPDTTLTDQENHDRFNIYLQGRDLAYSTIISNLTEHYQNLTVKQLPIDPSTPYYLLLEGQIEALKEITYLLKEKAQPTT